jgi:hypothetical protein
MFDHTSSFLSTGSLAAGNPFAGDSWPRGGLLLTAGNPSGVNRLRFNILALLLLLFFVFVTTASSCSPLSCGGLSSAEHLSMNHNSYIAEVLIQVKAHRTTDFTRRKTRRRSISRNSHQVAGKHQHPRTLMLPLSFMSSICESELKNNVSC